jgi:hypothetical protein
MWNIKEIHLNIIYDYFILVLSFLSNFSHYTIMVTELFLFGLFYDKFQLEIVKRFKNTLNSKMECWIT